MTWSCTAVPNNGSPPGSRYNVNITCPVPAITLDIPATIDSVRVEPGQSLAVTGGNLIIDSPSGITNHGTLSVGSGRSIVANESFVMGGGSAVELNAATASLSSATVSDAITVTGVVGGFGTIDARVQNNGTIRATASGETLLLSGINPVQNDATFAANDGGTLSIEKSVSGSGQYVADGGTLRMRPGIGGSVLSGSTLTVRSDGGIDIAGDGSNDFVATFSDGVTVSGNVVMRGSTPPIISAGDRSRIMSLSNISLDGAINATFSPTSLVQAGGSFANHCTTPETFDSTQATVEFVSGNGLSPQVFELAGVDVGRANPAGFVDNFALGRVLVDAGRSVRFEDAFDNTTTQPCDEVLYVDELDIGAGAVVSIDCGRVYFSSMSIGSGATITLLNNAGLIHVGPAWDIDGNGIRAAADVSAMVAALTHGPAANLAAYYRADANGDGRTDARDIQHFTAAYLGP